MKNSLSLPVLSAIAALLVLPAAGFAASPPTDAPAPAQPPAPANQPAWHQHPMGHRHSMWQGHNKWQSHSRWQGHRGWRGRDMQVLGSARCAVIAERLDLTAKQKTELTQLMRHPRMFNMLVQRRVQMDMLARRLELTMQQRIQIRGIATKTWAAVKPIRDNASLTAQQKQAQMHQLMAKRRAEIEAVLTPKQQARLARIRHHLLASLGPLS